MAQSPVMDATTIQHHVDRKAMRKTMEKKIAQGHAKDDRQEEFKYQQSM